MMKVLMLHGINYDMVGKRDPIQCPLFPTWQEANKP